MEKANYQNFSAAIVYLFYCRTYALDDSGESYSTVFDVGTIQPLLGTASRDGVLLDISDIRFGDEKDGGID